MRFILGCFSALLLAVGFSVSAMAMPEVGKPAPAFSAQDMNGKTVQLSDYAGKVVVLEWTNHECPFVKKFYGASKMQDMQKAAVADGVVWLSINSSAAGKQGHVTAADAQEVTKTRAWAGTAYLLDDAGIIGKAYGAKTTPHMFVINKDGVVAYMGAIDSKESTDAADIAGATNYVEAALKSLKDGKPVETASTRAYGCGVKYAD